jgi:nitrogen-specific signal transduction histidine kinase
MVASNTYFAPAGRASADVLDDQSRAVNQAEFVTTMLDTMPTLAMILNEHRQIVAVNNRLLKAFRIQDPALLIGRRPGEALGCIHFTQGPDGCGTAQNCSVCGAVKTILDSQKGGCQVSGECRVMLKDNGGTALDLEATASPLDVAEKRFTVFTLKDISADKRKQVMERTFFHDIINTAGGIRGLASLLVEQEDLSPEKEMEYKGLMVSLSDNLIEEIMHHRTLIAAEKGEYVPHLEMVDLNELLKEVCELHDHHEHTPGRNIRFESAETCLMYTDPPALRRIVGNMVLNGLEAVSKGETVQVRYRCLPESLRIEVSNPGVMPDAIQLQVFKRSFSSKATEGRGIGTYSMKLFGERYLGGKVGFTCRDGQTTFFIELPQRG